MADLADQLRNSGRFGPHRVGPFDIVGVLGRGGMGRVYKANQHALKRVVALKILDPEIASKELQVKRFLREARSAASLAHPNIVALHDVGTCKDSGLHYLALEFVDGPSVATELKLLGTFSERRAVEICQGVAAALTRAEEAQIVHRDVRPGNILLTANGQPKLSNLGLAKRQGSHSLTTPGLILGRPQYVSPEQALGKDDLDTRSDIYSLGVTLYELVTGELPFAGTSFFEIAKQHIEEDVPDPRVRVPELSENLALVLRCMCARNRNERYSSAADLEHDLRRLLAGVAPTGRDGTPSGDTKRLLGRQVVNYEATVKTSPYQLDVHQSGKEPQSIVIDMDRATIGRSSDCDVVIDNTLISRRHAALVRDGLTLSLSPLSSTNSTAVNDEPVADTVLLELDDAIILSETVLLHFRWASHDGEEDKNVDDTTRVLQRKTTMPLVLSPEPEFDEDEEGSYTTKIGFPGSKKLAGKNARTAARPYRFPRGFVVHQRSGAQVRDRVHKGFQLGQSSLCDARLPAPAPRKAALIVRCEDSYWLWNMCEDPNQITLNGEPVPDQAGLEDGDVIVVCGVELRFEQPH